jgi:non-homologous end joining protein Ku
MHADARSACEPSRTTVVNLMDALRRSVAQEKRPSAAPKKGRKRTPAPSSMVYKAPPSK